MRTGALILAAGLSSRMGEFKPLLEIDGKSLVETAIELFRDAGVQEIVTVVGHRSESLIPVVESFASRWVVNEHYQEGMFSSIQKGVAELRGRCDVFFLLPVDIPCVRSSTVKQLLERYLENPSTLVCYPEFNARRGHPPLIAGSLIDQILTYVGDGGMRGLLRRHEGQAANVPVADPFVLLDIDTREDYSFLRGKIKNYTG